MVKRKRMGMTLLMGSGILMAGCSVGVSADQWAATEGAIGRINMEEVEEAFKKSQTVEEFEKRLNEIFEGDGIVLIRAKEEDGKRVIEGYEDLNRNFEVDPEKDDLLFTIINEGDSNSLRGNGANQHYRSSFGGGNFLFTYLIFSSLGRGGFGYNTPRSRVSQMQTQRNSYRASTAYAGGASGGQVKKNSNYYSKQRAANRTAYNSSGKQLSPARQSYIGSTKSTGAFKTSNTGVRSGFGKFRGSSGRGGGARGFGGGQVVIGPR